MEHQPLISIIIPTYNSAKTLRQALTSVVSQTYKEIEVLIIDGCSTDGTLVIVQSYAAEDSRLKWVSEPDNGIYDAMNKGIQLAKGEWLYFLGSDDKLHDEYVLEKIFQTSLSENFEVIYGNIICNNKTRDGEFNYEKLMKRTIPHQAMFFKKDVVLKKGGYSLKYKRHADYELTIKLFCDPEIKFNYVNQIIADYNTKGFSSTYWDRDFDLDAEHIFLQNFGQHLIKENIYKALRPSSYALMKRGNYIRGMIRLFKSGVNLKTIKDWLFVTRFRLNLI